MYVFHLHICQCFYPLLFCWNFSLKISSIQPVEKTWLFFYFILTNKVAWYTRLPMVPLSLEVLFLLQFYKNIRGNTIYAVISTMTPREAISGLEFFSVKVHYMHVLPVMLTSKHCVKHARSWVLSNPYFPGEGQNLQFSFYTGKCRSEKTWF